MGRLLTTHPDIVEAHWAWFGISVILSTTLAALWSRRRRKAIGSVKYLAGWIVIVAPALFGAICVRGGYALAYMEQGMNGVLAQIAGSFWGLMFILLARIGLMLFPPSAWLLKEWRRANREASVFRRVFGSRAPGP